MLKDIEKENLGVLIKSPLTTKIVQQLAIVLVDDNYFASEGKKVVEKITKMLKRCTHLY